MFIVAIRQHDNVSEPILGIYVLIFSSQSEIICEAKVFGYTKTVCTQKIQYATVRLGAPIYHLVLSCVMLRYILT